MNAVLAPAEAYQQAQWHLRALDDDWARLVDAVGPCTHRPQLHRSPYEALVRAVAYQQLHARAGDAILARLIAAAGASGFPAPAQLLALGLGGLRGCGLSGPKSASVLGLAQATLDGVVPTLAEARASDDEALVRRLTALRGVGRWTAEMFLIYSLGRLDVLPVDDYGVRNGWRALKRLPTLPTPRELQRLARPCAPWRTVAAWYLWRLPALGSTA